MLKNEFFPRFFGLTTKWLIVLWISCLSCPNSMIWHFSHFPLWKCRRESSFSFSIHCCMLLHSKVGRSANHDLRYAEFYPRWAVGMNFSRFFLFSCSTGLQSLDSTLLIFNFLLQAFLSLLLSHKLQLLKLSSKRE